MPIRRFRAVWGHPGRGRMRGRAEDPDAAAGMPDDCEDVHPGARECDRFEKSAASSASAGERRNYAQVARPVRCRIDPGPAQDLPDRGPGNLVPEGELTAQSFLVDMNRLFEKWIGDELRARLYPAVEVVEQSAVPLSVSPPVTMNPDLVFRRDGEVVFVADVKYKLIGDGLARTSDYYQLLAYTTALRLPRGMLIYCRADRTPQRVITVVGGNQRLHTRPVDLGGSPEAICAALDVTAESIKRLS